MPMEMWIIVSLLLMRPAFCSISLDGFHGQFTSLNYPQGYPDNEQQSWDIQVPRGYGIKLYFSHINIEPSANCAYDYVQIFCDEALHPPICGSSKEEGDFQFPQEYQTTGNWMKVTFKSDFSNEERYTGFVAYYTAVDVDECKEEDPCSHYCNNYIGGFHCSCRPGYFLQENQRICGVNCSGEVFTKFKGIITSPNYPETYAENSECHYRIQIDPGFEVILQFTEDFEVEGDPSTGCLSDILKITSGAKEYGPFCGDSAPVIHELLSNEVEITFRTDDQGEKKGWKIMYKSTAKQCPTYILEHNVIQPNKSEYDYKDIVQLSCDVGFELYDSKQKEHISSAMLHCQKDGTWNSDSYSCRPVNCGPPSKLTNGRENFTSTVYRHWNTYSCEEPYYKLEGNAVFECSADAEWVDVTSHQTTMPKCKPVCGMSRLSSKPGRIFGGRPAELGDFPWQLRLIIGGSAYGGGALISDGWVLTAAHLFDNSHQVNIHGGIVDMRHRSRENQLPVEEVIVHPDYRKQVQMICAGKSGVDSCQGDSGGPFVFKEAQDQNRYVTRGIVSFGPKNCGVNGVYTDVEKYLDWIDTTIKKYESNEEN
ncbi:LOW QUALITY PROTEIN: complement C1s subcomponent-like [Chiloscyllium plagiosum]|uniref:LOW QUALITY PROTEIN: complement C1s subcomponent-like n=1 Tax=Chiloscyllium plagiosum TaxID=36176 RepID=UPI001CB7CEEE|nr:LOW QUALITY PROTEIN: complement C1s subcomponent-like [Chiloscyllium plagiosum]